MGCILANSGVDTEKVEAFKANCEKQYGENAALNPVNIIESRKFQVTTPEVKISIAPENSYLIETRIIDGRKCLVIPMESEVELNGIRVSALNSAENIIAESIPAHGVNNSDNEEEIPF